MVIIIFTALDHFYFLPHHGGARLGNRRQTPGGRGIIRYAQPLSDESALTWKLPSDCVLASVIHGGSSDGMSHLERALLDL